MEHLKPNVLLAKKRIKEKTEMINFIMSEDLYTLGINKKYFINTFGCQGNEADSEVISGILTNMGFEREYDEELSDVIILNTCAIRENAENRLWGFVGRYKALKTKNPNLVIIVCGCMPQEEQTVENIISKYPQIDIVFGTHNINQLPEYLNSFYQNHQKIIQVYSITGKIVEDLPKIRESKIKAWVNIMYGCDEFCTYCIVPITRGKERSRLKEEIIQEVKDLVSLGYQEITLLGQNVNAYGKDLNNGIYTFGDLLNDLSQTKIPRIRFTTSHPKDLDSKTIQAMRLPNVMPHLHLPVQSGSNEILKTMNRKYTKEEYLEKINQMKLAVNDISITTDIIVGFPGETDHDFLETIDLVNKVNFEGAYTFIYSKREGTPAAKFDDNISLEEKHHRLDILHEVVNEGSLNGNKRFLNKIVKVLVDGYSKNDSLMVCGYTEHNKLVNFAGNENDIGKIIDVKIIEAKTWFLIGEKVKNA